MFDDYDAQPQPRHRNLPRGGLAMPFPDEVLSITPETAECALCGSVTTAANKGPVETAEAPAERINSRWARHLASISHELRAPLTGIAGFASLLDGPDLTDEQHQLVRRINDCSDTMLNMVNDLLDEAMAQNGDVRIASQPFSPAQLARNCTAMVAASDDSGSAAISCRIDRSVPDVARGDPQRLKQILTNLMMNAVAATAKTKNDPRNSQGQVQLVLRQRGHRHAPKLVWSVVDNGSGLSADEKDRIFSPFEQGPLSSDQTGTGLGLSIAQKLAEKMAGSITVRSTPDRGSVFTLHQPLRRTDPVQVPLSSLNSLQLPRVLVAQPNHEDRRLTQSVLQVFGFQFDHVSDTAETVTMLRRAELDDYPYIAVLLDVDAEADTACHVVRTLRTAGMTANALPAYALSSNSSKSERARYHEAGFQGVLPKPLTHTAFADLARSLVAPTPKQSEKLALLNVVPTPGGFRTARQG